MAKLNVTIPAVDVEVNGVKYSKVDRKAQAGDIVKALTNSFADVTNGAFYEVYGIGDGCLAFKDNADDARVYPLRDYPERFEVYEKVSVADTEPATPQYREEQTPLIREVKRPAKVGERIRIVEATESAGYYKNGDVLTVRDADRWDNGRAVSVDGFSHGIYHREYVVLEPITQPERLHVGDYAKVIDASGDGASKIGDIIEIDSDGHLIGGKTFDGRSITMFAHRFVRATAEEVAAAKDPRSQFAEGDNVRLISGGGEWPLYGFTNGEIYEVQTPKYDDHVCAPVVQIVGGRRGVGNGYAKADQLKKVSAEELAEIEREAVRAAERAKWAAIGRKVGEIKVGDVVEVVSSSGRNPVGRIGIAHRVDGPVAAVATVDYPDSWACWTQVKLIVPVEQRFDKPDESADIPTAA
jgi:transcription antitermination factor NusG